jgi:hypothetical protein
MYAKIIYTATLVALFAFYPGFCMAQLNKVSTRCDTLLSNARLALKRGDVSTVDTIYYRDFPKLPCAKTTLMQSQMLTVMSDRMAASGYWKEKEDFDAKIKAIAGNDPGDGWEILAHQFIAIEGRYGRGFSGGDLHIAGLRYGRYFNDGVGFEIGAAYQQFTTVIKETNNKDDNGKYFNDGYYFQGATRTDAWTLSAAAGWSNSYPEELFWDIKGSFGITGGVEAVLLTHTSVKSYYKEVVFSDEEVTRSQTLSQHQLGFNVIDRSEYPDDKFFKSKTLVRIYFGPQYRLQWKSMILGFSAHFMSSTLPRLKVNEFDKVYAPGAYLAYGVHLAWVFKKQKRGNEEY